MEQSSPEKLIVSHLVNIFPVSYGTLEFSGCIQKSLRSRTACVKLRNMMFLRQGLSSLTSLRLEMEAVCSSETLVSSYKSTQRYKTSARNELVCACFLNSISALTKIYTISIYLFQFFLRYILVSILEVYWNFYISISSTG
jgi:hypothetical protein